MAGYRITLSSATSGTIPASTEMKPLFSGEFTYKLESGELFYKKELKEKLRFPLQADYTFLKAQETADECEKVNILIEKLCGGVYTEEWRGDFTMFDATVNDSRCFIEVEPKPIDEYACYEDIKDEEVNAFFATNPKVISTAIGGTYQTVECSGVRSGVGFAEWVDYFNLDLWFDGCLAGATSYTVRENKLIINGTDYSKEFPYNETEPFDISVTTTWHREIITSNCVGGACVVPTLGTGWNLLTDDCVGSGECTYYREPVSGLSEPLGDYSNGVLFNDVVTSVVNALACDYVVKSDFFNINPVGDAPVNTEYAYAESYLQNMTFHHKSDIKRRNSTNPTTSEAWDFTPEDFFSDLKDLFNVYVVIKNGVFIIEHYTFFTSVVGADDTSVNMLKQVERDGEVKKKLTYKYLDEVGNTAFANGVIRYNCGNDNDERKLKLFSMDLAYIQDTTNADRVSDDGFVLISNTLFNGGYIINNDNQPLAWKNLLPSLHLAGAMFPTGTINGAVTTFTSVIPYINQEPYFLTLCCGDTFNPEELRTTWRGNGKVKNATHNIITGKLEIELSY